MIELGWRFTYWMVKGLIKIAFFIFRYKPPTPDGD